jgi:hypothetical protein
MVQPEMLDPSCFPFLRSRTRIKALKATDELLRRPGLVAEPFRLLKNCTVSLYIYICVCVAGFVPAAGIARSSAAWPNGALLVWFEA